MRKILLLVASLWSAATFAATPTHFSVTAPHSTSMGSAFTFTVTALDASGDTVTTYVGPAHFTSTDAAAVLPANAALTGGVGSFSATLNTSGSQTITAADASTPTIAGTSNGILVSLAAPLPTSFVVTAPGSATIANSFSFSVTAVNASGSTVTTYSGPVSFASSDPAATLPSVSSLANGVGTFSATLKTAGSQTITVSDVNTPSIRGVSGTIVASTGSSSGSGGSGGSSGSGGAGGSGGTGSTGGSGSSGGSGGTGSTGTAPQITLQPSSTTSSAGAGAAFWITAQGTPPLTYQWSVNGSPLNGVTGAALLLNNVQTSSDGSYTVTVSNSAGSVTSSAATLTVAVAGGSPPQMQSSPASQSVATGSTVVFTVSASSGSVTTSAVESRATTALSYQWFFDGAVLAGATDASLVVSNAGSANAGNYICIVTNSAGAVESGPAILSVITTTNPGRLLNLSCLGTSGPGAPLIVGFVVGGQGVSGTEPLLIRASGPALAPLGVPAVLPDPQLTLNNGAGVAIAMNAGWAGNTQIATAAAAVGAFAWPSDSSHDAALLESLGPGNYSAQISGTSGDSGTALAEAYDCTPTGSYTTSEPRLINLSALNRAGSGSDVLTAGFVVGGTTAKTILIRASGPALNALGVAGTLPDPQLQLYAGAVSPTLLQTNTGWAGDSQIAAIAASVGAFSWGTSATPDSALLVTLAPGAYSAQISGASGDSGVALVELYEVP